MLRVEPLHRNAPVYNITVDGEHEFFANGVLVSNCDAARYAYAAMSHYLSKVPQEPADKGTKEALQAEEARIEMRLDQKEARRAQRLADGDEDYLESLGEEVI